MHPYTTIFQIALNYIVSHPYASNYSDIDCWYMFKNELVGERIIINHKKPDNILPHFLINFIWQMTSLKVLELLVFSI